MVDAYFLSLYLLCQSNIKPIVRVNINYEEQQRSEEKIIKCGYFSHSIYLDCKKLYSAMLILANIALFIYHLNWYYVAFR